MSDGATVLQITPCFLTRRYRATFGKTSGIGLWIRRSVVQAHPTVPSRLMQQSSYCGCAPWVALGTRPVLGLRLGPIQIPCSLKDADFLARPAARFSRRAVGDGKIWSVAKIRSLCLIEATLRAPCHTSTTVCQSDSLSASATAAKVS